MKMILFGATGMVGQGVLRDDPCYAPGCGQASIGEPRLDRAWGAMIENDELIEETSNHFSNKENSWKMNRRH